jgi:1,4-dihydroxy-2-naphthoyl-CoA hydrolase
MNPEITADGIAEFQQGSFPHRLGVEPLELEDGLARGRMVVDERHLHPFGYLHGGAWVALADTVAAWGTLRHLQEGDGFTTVELKTNVFAAGQVGDELVATASPLHLGRRTQVWEVRIHKGEKLMANFVCTQMVLPGVTR